MDKQEFDYSSAAAAFTEERPVWKQIWDSICKELLPNRKNWFGAVFSIVLALALSIILATSEKTVSLSQNICGILMDVQLSIFGCIFAVYSILLAFLSDSYVKRLLRIDYHEKSSYLEASTRYYESALLIYLVAILLSLTCKLLLECIPEDYALTNNHLLNEFMAFTLLLVYFLFSIRTIYELRSIITNTLLLFRTSIQYKILDFSSESSNEALSENDEANQDNHSTH